MEKYTSFDLSRKLSRNGCELESEYILQEESYYDITYNGSQWYERELIKKDTFAFLKKENRVDIFVGISYPSYDILWEICVKYAKEFFGDNHLKLANQLFKIVANPCSQQTIENFIWDNCVFNPENKEKK